MESKRKYNKRPKEIWYETTQEKMERKNRYQSVSNQRSKKIDENLTLIIILLLFIIGLILLWIKQQNLI